MDELRFRMSDRKSKLCNLALDFSESIISASTHMNSNVNRSQFLLELFGAEVDFQYAKMEVISLSDF